MGRMMVAYDNIDEYIEAFPPAVQKTLEKLRRTIRKAAPKAEEAIKYGIPTFVLNGNLVHFAAFKEHIGFYPDPRGIEEFRPETTRYESGKGTLRFPLDEPIPFDLVARIVKYRVQKNLEKAEPKRKKK
jgi:uncharacterized protein YdhG (YjbR/CyaY superfamily)